MTQDSPGETQTIKAGELGGFYIGHIVRVQVAVATYVEDELAGLMHNDGKILIRFVHVQPGGSERLNMFGSNSFEVDFDSEVEVIEP